MITDNFDVSEFNLVENLSYSPNTGIKIDYTAQESYQAQSTFRFTDATAYKDASLKDLIVSSGTKDGEEHTYKEYELTPTFDKEVKEYEITLLEYVDKMNITAIQNNEKATMKVKHPKRNEDGNIVYETDGTTIVYEEKELLNNTEYMITLNELGKEDTNITILITAEDGKTTDEYKIKIKRPYGTIKGKIYTAPTASTTGKYIATVRVYKSEDVSKIINWSEVTPGTDDIVHKDLMTLTSNNIKTNDDGTYEIYVIPNKYDILLDKAGYLDDVYIERQVDEGNIVDLGESELIARRY